MISIKLSFSFSVFIILLLISSSILSITYVSAIGAYTATTPTIDGTIGDVEWRNAEIGDFDFGEHDGFHYLGKLYVMNDVENLYMAFEIADPDPSQARLTLIFDDDSDDIVDDGARFEQITAEYSDLNSDLNPDVSQDGEMLSTFGAERNYFEFSKRRTTGDADDFDVEMTFPLRYMVIYRTGGLVLESGIWEEIVPQLPLKVSIQNVRYPDEVMVDQITYVTLDVECEFYDPDLEFDLDLLIIDIDAAAIVLDSYSDSIMENKTVTHTFELTAPPAPQIWTLRINALADFSINGYSGAWELDHEIFSIEIKEDLDIAPEVEGICIWDGPPPPETALPSEQIEIPIEVKYAVTYDAWIVAGIYDEEGSLISSVEFDERVSGVGSNDYIFEVTTPDSEGTWNLKASLYYGHVIGVDSVHEECDEWPFTLIVTSGVLGGEGVKIIDVTSPVEVNSGDEVLVNVNVEYELPAGAKYHVSILESTSSLIIKTSDEMTAASHGFETFSFDGIYAPFVLTDTIFTLRAVAEYKTDGDWQILDPEGLEEFEIKVLGVSISPGDLPLGPPIPPLPFPPDSLPPTPENFDFTLSLTPDSQEASPGQTVSYEVELQGSIEETQLVTLGVSGQPLGSTVNIIPLAGTPTYSSTLTITLGDSVQPESYTITVNASGGEKTHSQSASLIVKSPPDFSISLSTPEVTVEQGESTSIDINIEPLHGFNTPVNLAVTSSPNGVEAKLNPESEIPAFTSKIEISVENDMAAGTYPLIITAEGSAQKSSQVILNVEAPRQTAAATQPQFPYAIFALIVIILLIVAAILAFRRRKTNATAPPTAPMKFCIECGAQIPIDTLHCPKCGVKQQ
jgi:ribosomal protein L40E